MVVRRVSLSSSGGGTGGDSGVCQTGMTQGTDVAILGDEFIAASHQITAELETIARDNGSLPADESYVDNSVSGTTLASNQIASGYDRAVQSYGTIEYVLMNGGRNDCLLFNNATEA